MKIFLLLLLGLSAFSVYGQQGAPAGDAVFQDPQYPFSITLPKGWKRLDRPHSTARLAAVSENGEGAASFNVNAGSVPGKENVASADYVKLFLEEHPEALDDIAQSNLTGARVVSSGPATLGGKEAFSLIFEGNYKVVNQLVPMKLYLVQMLFEGNVYTLVFACGKADFEKDFPSFQQVVAGFKVTPKPVKTAGNQ